MHGDNLLVLSDLLEPRSGQAVAQRAIAVRKRRVGRTAQQRVAKAILASPREAGTLRRGNRLLLDERVEDQFEGRRFPPDEGADPFEREDVAVDARRSKRLSRSRV